MTTTGPTPTQPRSWTILLVIMLSPVLLVGSCMAIASSGSSDGPTSEHAASACRDAVRPRLKNPASAQFSGERAISTADGWTITGTVRAQNSFGGMAVHTYTCATDMERVTSIDIDR